MRYKITTSVLAAVGIVAIGWGLAQPFMIVSGDDHPSAEYPSIAPALSASSHARSPSPRNSSDLAEVETQSVSPQQDRRQAEQLRELAKRLAVMDEESTQNSSLQTPPTWVMPISNLDMLIEQGPETRSGPADTLVPINVVEKANFDSRQSDSWQPNPKAPLPDIARFEFVRVSPSGAASVLPASTANQSTRSGLSAKESEGFQPIIASNSTKNAAAPQTAVRSTASPFTNAPRIRSMEPESGALPPHLVLQPSLRDPIPAVGMPNP